MGDLQVIELVSPIDG